MSEVQRRRDQALQFLEAGVAPPGQLLEKRPTGRIGNTGADTRRERAERILAGSTTEPLEGITTPGGALFRSTPEGQQVLENLADEGVDIVGGVGGGGMFDQDRRIRSMIGLMPHERRDALLKEQFPMGHRDTPVGLVVTVQNDPGDPVDEESEPQTRDVLLDETGMTLGDIADASDETLVAFGALLSAGIAVASGGTSVMVIAAASAVGGQTTGGIGEYLAALSQGGIDLKKKEDVALLERIIKSRGIAAGIDFLMDTATAGGAKFTRAGTQKVVGPFADRMAAEPQRSIKEAADRLDLQLPLGEKTGSETLARTEAILGKVPGGSGLIQAAEDRLQERLRGIIDDAAPRTDIAKVGEEVSAEIAGQQQRLTTIVDEENLLAQRIAQGRINHFSEEMGRRSLSTNESGNLQRRVVQRERLRFKGRQQALSEVSTSMIDALPIEQQAFAPTLGLKSTAKELEDQFPKQTIVTETPSPVLDAAGRPMRIVEETTRKKIGEFFPEGAKKILAGIKKLDKNVTVQELRNARSVISDAIDDAAAFPGVGKGMLRKLEGSFTKAIKEAIENAPTPEIKDALTAELSHFRTGIQGFRSQHIARVLREEGQPGFIEGDGVLHKLFLANRTEDIKRLLRLTPANERNVVYRAAARSTFEELMQKSRDSLSGDDFIDPVKLLRQVDRLKPATQELLFAGKQNEVKQLLRLQASALGKVDLSALRLAPGNGDLVALLRAATSTEIAKQQIFERGIMPQIIAGRIDGGNFSPEELVRRTLVSSVSRRDVRAMMDRLPPETLERYRRGVAFHIFEQSALRSADDTELIRLMNTNQLPVGDNLMEMLLKDFGGNTQASLGKLEDILGNDSVSILRDLATVEQGRKVKAAAGRAVGGLTAGSIISNLLRAQGLTAIPSIIKFHIAARLLQFPVTRAWLASTLRIPTIKGKTQAFITAAPQIALAVDAATNDSERTETVMKWLRQLYGAKK
jgi:hypothetical protein